VVAIAARTVAVRSSRPAARPARPAGVTTNAAIIQVWIQALRTRSAWMIGSDSSSGRW
jgi:hypothetical protein